MAEASLFLPYAWRAKSQSRLEGAGAHVLSIETVEERMPDIIFLALGIGGFAVMGAYAALCDRL